MTRKELEEEIEELREIIDMGRRREYHSKFLKDFQKEYGKNVFPDHDEIYKRYDNYKLRVDKAIKYIKSYLPNYDFDHSNLEKLLEILEGEENEL